MRLFRLLFLLFSSIIFFFHAFSQGLPIHAARTISFTTEEGTDMNVDVSPDGKQLVFDLLGDLYMVLSSGGKAKQITRGMALNTRPAWSYDGKKIAYISDEKGDYHIHTIDIQGHSKGVGGLVDYYAPTMQNPAWLPNGNYIGIEGTAEYIDLAGNKSLLPAEMLNGLLRCSLDGKKLFYYKIDADAGGAFIYKYDITTHVSERVSSVAIKRFSESMALSADLHWFALVSDVPGARQLSIIDLQSGQEKVLIANLLVNDTTHKGFMAKQHFCFSPDSHSIYIGFAGKIHRLGIEDGSDEIIPFSANVKVDAGPFNYHTSRVSQGSEYAKYTRSASKSPDGKHMVFAALGKIYIIDLPHVKPRQLVSQTASQFQPVFSDDGKWVAYTSWSDTVGGFLWKVPVTGGVPVQLTNTPGMYQGPAWSPDGNSIAVFHGAPKLGDRGDVGLGSSLELVPSSGGPPEILDDSVTLVNNVRFSPDGKNVIYTPFSKGRKLQLISLGVNDKTIRPLVAGIEKFNKQKALSPDGKYLLYSAQEDLFLVALPKGDSIINMDKMPATGVIRFAAGVDPYWEKDSKHLAWTYSNHFYRLDLDKLIKAATATLESERHAGSIEKQFITTHISPDETIVLPAALPAGYGQGVIAFKNARIITMKGNHVLQHGTIVIRNGRILSVGLSNKILIPKSAKIYDLAGKTIIPGLIDLHLHMRVPSSGITPQQSWMLMVNLAYGITTARDPSSSFDSFGYAEMVRGGLMRGPRLFTVGCAARSGDGMARTDNFEDFTSVVGKRKFCGAIVVKNYLEVTSRLHRQWLAKACYQARINMTNEGWFDSLSRVGMIKDGSTGIEHNGMWDEAYTDIIKLYAKSGIYFTPTLQVSPPPGAKEYFNHVYWHGDEPKLQRFMPIENRKTGATINGYETYNWITSEGHPDTTTDGFLYLAKIDARIKKAGGRVCLGSHGNDEGIGAHNELWALQLGGFSNLEALQAATIRGAEALGVQQDLGSIEVGKIADLLILNSNPLDDIHNSKDLQYVMKDGILYDANTLDETWPKKQTCPDWRIKKIN